MNKKTKGILLAGIGILLNASTSSAAPSVTNGEAAAVNGALSLASGSSPQQVLKNGLSSYFSRLLDDASRKWLPNTEFSVTGFNDGKPVFSILTVRPLSESEDLRNTLLGQASVFVTDERQTLNLGLGHRWMTEKKLWLFGVNGFYDHEFPRDHQRTSLGVEARSSVIEVNANRYFALSEWKNAKDGTEERALGGHDLEIGLALPFIPSSKIYHKQFRWLAHDGVSDLKGKTTSLDLSADLITPGLSLVLGITNYDARSDKNFVQVTYRYPPANKKVKPFLSDQAYKFESMEDQRLNKVRRENLIVKQVRSGAGGLTVEFR